MSMFMTMLMFNTSPYLFLPDVFADSYVNQLKLDTMLFLEAAA